MRRSLATHAIETIAAVIGDLERASAVIKTDPGGDPGPMAATLATLAGELADLARALQSAPSG